MDENGWKQVKNIDIDPIDPVKFVTSMTLKNTYVFWKQGGN